MLATAERRRLLLATALEAVRQGVAFTDGHIELPGPKLLFVNDYLCEMSGYTAEELSGQRMQILMARAPDHVQGERMIRELHRGRPVDEEFVHRRKDGSEHLVFHHVSPVLDADGELTHLVSIQQDVTERRRADEALRSSEERYRLLIERMNEGFVATDRDNRIDLVNAKFIEMLGHSREELHGRYLGDLCDADNRSRLEQQEERRRHGLAAPYEVTWTARDGRKIDTVVSPTSLQDADGRFIGSFAVVTDVTERKRSEEQRRRLERRIQQAQKMESLGLLAGGVAHDFNNLLVGVLGNAGLALMELPSRSPVYELVRQIEIAALRASELTNEMLSYSGKGKVLIEAIDLSALVEEMAQLLRASISKKSTLELDFASPLGTIEGDPSQIRQVVMNVITNASEAIDDQVGTIQLITGEMHAGRDYLAATYMDDGLEPGRYVYLEVVDSGSGMDAETLGKIFDPFFTTKFTGRGLGLAAALGIVRGHAGAVKVTSAVGRGTSFRVLFPFSGRPLAKSAERSGRPPANVRRSGCVLVVDDEEMVRKVAAATLESVGYSVLTATDGRDAVELFRRRGDEVDAVLLDMTMPRMGGEEACREIRRLRPDAKIIVASGFSEQEAAQRFADEDVDGFLQKPFRPNALVGRVEKLLAKSRRA